MEVPWQKLSPGALRGVVEEFITREGTDYGESYSLDQKVAHVMAQLRRKEAIVVFDEETETCNIIARRSAPSDFAGDEEEEEGEEEGEDQEA